MGPAIELPKYKCHKEVWALKIADISLPNNDNYSTLSFEEKEYAPIPMDGEWMNKHKPEVGGYYVVYKDGYKSFSPADAFEEGYIKI